MPGLSDLRDQMAINDRWCYLDHAAVAPIPRPTAHVMHTWIHEVSSNGAANWGTWRKSVEEFRQAAARLLDAVPEEIAFIRNTTEGVSLIAQGWNWSKGDSVVVPDCEFPSNLYPWMALAAQGVDVRIVPDCAKLNGDDLCKELLNAMDHSTKMVAVSWVDYSSGRRRPLDQLAEAVHRRGAVLFVDAIQGLGALPLSVRSTPVDFLAADGHKWLLGPEGGGILYVRNTLLDRLRCSGPGWNSVAHAGDFENHNLELKAGAARFEAGTYPAVTVTGLLESLKLLESTGYSRVHAAILHARQLFEETVLRSGFSCLSLPPSEQSGIISIECPGRPRDVMRHLRAHRILANVRGGRLRISPHAYHSDADLELFADVLARSAGC